MSESVTKVGIELLGQLKSESENLKEIKVKSLASQSRNGLFLNGGLKNQNSNKRLQRCHCKD